MGRGCIEEVAEDLDLGGVPVHDVEDLVDL
jgi:hypothetical protein